MPWLPISDLKFWYTIHNLIFFLIQNLNDLFFPMIEFIWGTTERSGEWKHSSIIPTVQCFVSHVKPHLLLITLLQQLHVAASLAVRSSQGGAPMLRQVRRRGHTSTLRINPGIDMVGDIATWNPPDRTHRETKLFTALQHLRRRGEERRVNSRHFINTSQKLVFLRTCMSVNLKHKAFPQINWIWFCQTISYLHMNKNMATHTLWDCEY